MEKEEDEEAKAEEEEDEVKVQVGAAHSAEEGYFDGIKLDAAEPALRAFVVESAVVILLLVSVLS